MIDGIPVTGLYFYQKDRLNFDTNGIYLGNISGYPLSTVNIFSFNWEFLCVCVWRLPKMGVPRVIIRFRLRFSTTNQPFWGIAIYGSPHIFRE